MRRHKIIAGVLIFAFLIGTAFGCSSIKKSEESAINGQVNTINNSNLSETADFTAMGCYVEEDIALPKGVKNGTEKICQLIKNAEGKIELSCRAALDAPGEDAVIYNLKANNIWVRDYPKWLNQQDRARWLNSYLAYSEDGKRYALSVYPVIEENRREAYVMESKDGNTAEQVKLDNYNINEAQRILALPGSGLLLNSLKKCSIFKDGKETEKFIHKDSLCCTVSGNLLMLPNALGNKVCIYDISTSQMMSEIKLPDSPENMAFTADKDGHWYMVSNTGIFRLAKKGNTWERIVDGSMGAMSDPTLDIWDIVLGDNGDIYVNYGSCIKHYVYHKDVPTFPSQTLTITSLKDNNTIRKAMLDFMDKNPDIKVEFHVLMDSENSLAVSDYIKAVNTELAAGKGSDLYILDQMPVDSYIDKGILADLSDILNPMIEDQTLAGNKLEAYRTDGKLYYAPLRFGIELAYGKRTAVAATGNLDTLAEYVKNNAAVPLLGKGFYSYKDLIRFFYINYSDGLLEGAFKKERLEVFLKDIKNISNQSKSVDTVKDTYYSSSTYNASACELYFDQLSELAFIELNNIQDIYEPMTVISMTAGDLAGINKKEFIPYGFIGMNNASANRKIAADFIKECYSEAIQKLNLYDGLPVNRKALKDFGMEKVDYVLDNVRYIAGQPNKKRMQQLIDLAYAADTPVHIDNEILDLLIADAVPYLKGKATLQDTADKIIDKISNSSGNFNKNSK